MRQSDSFGLIAIRWSVIVQHGTLLGIIDKAEKFLDGFRVAKVLHSIGSESLPSKWEALPGELFKVNLMLPGQRSEYMGTGVVVRDHMGELCKK